MLFRSLQEAMKMVKILEESYHTEKGKQKEGMVEKYSKKPWKGKEAAEDKAKGKGKVKRLSKDEVQERIKKGLCFKCGDKWSKEHKCKTGQVLMIADTSDEENKEAIKEESEEEENHQASSESEEAELSLHALSGTRTPSTMRLMAWIGKHEVTLLVDSGSSHNFINASIIKKLGLQGVAVEPFEVKVANGEKLRCEEMVRDVKMNVQGVRIVVNLHVLTIAGLDVEIGRAHV